MPLSVKTFFSNFLQLPWEEIPFSDWVQIVIGLLSLVATIVISFFIYWLQSRHEKEIEQLQKAQRKAELENKADQFLIEQVNEDICRGVFLQQNYTDTSITPERFIPPFANAPTNYK